VVPVPVLLKAHDGRPVDLELVRNLSLCQAQRFSERAEPSTFITLLLH
jgi:hypothetical protein